MISITMLFKRFPELQSAFKYILNNNPTNYAPYHNLNHLINVTRRCYTLADASGVLIEDMDDLLIAAMFHDTDHSIGVETDDNNNLKRCLRFFQQYVVDKQVNINHYSVEKIMLATKYPHEKIKNISLKEMIIRDADLLGFIEDDRFINRIVGLSREFNISINDMINSEIDFVSKISLKLDCSQEYNTQLKYWIEELKQYRLFLK